MAQNRPRLIRPDIIAALSPAVAVPETEVEALGFSLTDYYDIRASLEMTRNAQTILFSTDQAIALRPALERFAEDLEYRLPFPGVILQFDRPIPESEFLASESADLLSHLETGIEGDQILALLMSQTELTDGRILNNVAAYFASTSVNRIQWHNEPRAHMRIHPLAESRPDYARHNKEVIRNLAIACIAYINCENITLDRQAAPEKVNRKRRKQGKKELEPFYLCRIRGVQYAPGEGERSGGSAHGYRYDVRGHFRRLPDGRLTWVRPHQRGLEHELYKPKTYKAG